MIFRLDIAALSPGKRENIGEQGCSKVFLDRVLVLDFRKLEEGIFVSVMHRQGSSVIF